MSDDGHRAPRLIKKYANRRLYDTHTSTHVTLPDIRQLVIDEVPFQVVDAKTGEDLTRSILLQIIQEAESDGEPLFSSDMLKGIIRFYGPFQGMLGNYLEKEHPDCDRNPDPDRGAILTGLERLYAQAGARHAGDDEPVRRTVEEALLGHPEPIRYVRRHPTRQFQADEKDGDEQ